MIGPGIVTAGVAAPLSGEVPPVGAIQLISEDFPNPRPYPFPNELRSFTQSMPDVLIGKDQFFYGNRGPSYDWPNPRGYIFPHELRSWIWATPLNLLSKDKFFGAAGQGPAYDWPNPRGYTFPNDLRGWIQPSFALQVFKPFFGLAGHPTFDFPNPRGYVFPNDLRSWTQSINLELLLYPATPTLGFAKDVANFTAAASDSPSGQNWSGPGFQAKYEIDTDINIVGIFRSGDGTAIDPTAVTLLISDPAGTILTLAYSGAPGVIVRDGVGHYHYTLNPSRSGTWTYKWQATGAAIATSSDATFAVNPSALIAG